jgi:hypothetical protein
VVASSAPHITGSPKPTLPADAELRRAVTEMLRSADLESVTPRDVRNALEKRFCVSLQAKMGQLREMMRAFIEAAAGSDTEDSEEEDAASRSAASPVVASSAPHPPSGTRGRARDRGGSSADDEDSSDDGSGSSGEGADDNEQQTQVRVLRSARKFKLLRHLKNEIFVRLKRGKHGVGVEAIRELPNGTDPFKLNCMPNGFM